ncbi:MAG: class I SAM-dependent methyltransferase [Planctomycetota bacterium]|jgi:hypothetical protein
MHRKILDYLVRIVKPWEECEFANRRLFSTAGLKVFLKKLYLWSKREVAIRYLPVLKELRIYPADYSTILEVGSGPLGLALHTKRKIIGVDIAVTGPRYQNMILVNSDAASLPFKKNTFDLVVSLDMFEHIPKQFRQKVLAELMRVSRKKIIIGMPSGIKAEEWEERVRKIYDDAMCKLSGLEKNRFIERNIFLSQHYQCGLPKEEEIRMYIDEERKKYSEKMTVKVLENESIYVWYNDMLGNMKYNYLRWFVTTFLYMIFFPILSRIKWGGCYRKIFIVEKAF